MWTNKRTNARPIVRSLLKLIKMSELTSDDEEETFNLASATIIFSSCPLLFGLTRKGVLLCGFKATFSLVNTESTSLVLVCLSVQMEFDTAFITFAVIINNN